MRRENIRCPNLTRLEFEDVRMAPPGSLSRRYRCRGQLFHERLSLPPAPIRSAFPLKQLTNKVCPRFRNEYRVPRIVRLIHYVCAEVAHVVA